MKNLLITACLVLFLGVTSNSYGLTGNIYNDDPRCSSYEICKDLADRGYPNAQVILGVMYVEGAEIPQDYVQARKYFKLAVLQGRRDGMNNLGNLYSLGLGGEIDHKSAIALFTRASKLGSEKASITIANLYLDGTGFPEKSHSFAYLYFKLSINQSEGKGHAFAVDYVKKTEDDVAARAKKDGTPKREFGETTQRLLKEITSDAWTNTFLGPSSEDKQKVSDDV